MILTAGTQNFFYFSFLLLLFFFYGYNIAFSSNRLHFYSTLDNCFYTVKKRREIFGNMLILNIRQLYENYRRKSGDGLSLVFLIIWLIGDIFSMIGVVMEKLMFTMVTQTIIMYFLSY